MRISHTYKIQYVHENGNLAKRKWILKSRYMFSIQSNVVNRNINPPPVHIKDLTLLDLLLIQQLI